MAVRDQRLWADSSRQPLLPARDPPRNTQGNLIGRLRSPGVAPSACGGAWMELRHLEHFVAVAEERHFSRAAQGLHIVQSGLSASIRALEQEIGAPLFLRTTRRVTLTADGRAFLPEARRAL